MHVCGGSELLAQWILGARVYFHVFSMDQRKHIASVAEGMLQFDIACDGRHADHLKLRQLERCHDGNCIIFAGVHIHPYRNAHMRTSLPS